MKEPLTIQLQGVDELELLRFRGDKLVFVLSDGTKQRCRVERDCILRGMGGAV